MGRFHRQLTRATLVRREDVSPKTVHVTEWEVECIMDLAHRAGWPEWTMQEGLKEGGFVRVEKGVVRRGLQRLSEEEETRMVLTTRKLFPPMGRPISRELFQKMLKAYIRGERKLGD